MTSILDNGHVEFRFFRPGASEVQVSGDFNAWADTLKMIPECDGWWSAEIEIQAGKYRFKYLADGDWYLDYASHGVEPSNNTWNSVLVIPDICLELPKINVKHAAA